MSFIKKLDICYSNLKRPMGLYEVENINNQNICTMAINPKEYFENLETYQLIKIIKE